MQQVREWGGRLGRRHGGGAGEAPPVACPWCAAHPSPGGWMMPTGARRRSPTHAWSSSCTAPRPAPPQAAAAPWQARRRTKAPVARGTAQTQTPNGAGRSSGSRGTSNSTARAVWRRVRRSSSSTASGAGRPGAASWRLSSGLLGRSTRSACPSCAGGGGVEEGALLGRRPRQRRRRRGGACTGAVRQLWDVDVAAPAPAEHGVYLSYI
jgi:hypothetical protein